MLLVLQGSRKCAISGIRFRIKRSAGLQVNTRMEEAQLSVMSRFWEVSCGVSRGLSSSWSCSLFPQFLGSPANRKEAHEFIRGRNCGAPNPYRRIE